MINKIKYIKGKMKKTLCDSGIPTKTKDRINEFIGEFESSTHTLESSTKLLNLSVNDMLSLAQIESSKFRKTVAVFDIRDNI